MKCLLLVGLSMLKLAGCTVGVKVVLSGARTYLPTTYFHIFTEKLAHP